MRRPCEVHVEGGAQQELTGDLRASLVSRAQRGDSGDVAARAPSGDGDRRAGAAELGLVVGDPADRGERVVGGGGEAGLGCVAVVDRNDHAVAPHAQVAA